MSTFACRSIDQRVSPTHHVNLSGCPWQPYQRGKRKRPCWCLRAAVGLLSLIAIVQFAVGASLEEQLRQESPADLVAAARQQGDAQRGAIAFYQPYMACRSCHAANSQGYSLGPDLTQWPRPVEDQYLVEAILHPSAKIREGYESVTVETNNGTTFVGLVENESDQSIRLRDPSQPGRRLEFVKSELEVLQRNDRSVMPEQLVNQLAGRQQFLDLLRYLIEIRDGGQLAARNLEPAPHLYAARPIPAYEQNIDHAAMIAELGDENFKRGKAIYQRVCANCHGTHDTMGSLPTSLRFATGQFKNGSDPYTMYQTLTRGFGMMQPQTWMVPQQKYDVIHYIRQAYLKRHNASQYVDVTDAWLKSLPTGSSRGPDAQVMEPWITMDYGPMLINTYEIGDDGHNFAYKGIAVRLDHGPGGVARGRHWMIFDHDTLRVAAAWSGSGFIDWAGIHFDGQHGRHPRVAGAVAIENRTGPGWQHPTDETWEDTRIVGRDGRRYGPLPREWGDYQGVYRHDDRAIIAYRIGTTDILESPLLLADQPTPVFARRIELQPHASSLTLRVADLPADATSPASINSEHVIIGNQEQNAYLVAGVRDATATTEWIVDDRSVQLRLHPSNTPASLTLWFTSVDATDNATGIVQQVEGLAPADGSLSDSIHGGEPTMPDVVTTQPVVGSDDGSFAVDVLTYPDANPWLARVRLTGFDFFEDGDSLAICSWDGDVWKVTGVDLLDGPLTWRRVARGLFQPLGLRIVDGEIFVTCRDQLVKLHDLNGDDEIDHYECFNHDHQVTEHFHEFAMGLQTDAEGNFYYAKSARHALKAIVPHHGTLLRISADGQHTDILANGFRAANGVCLNEDGTFIVTDQEGHWNPKNRINWVHEGGFYGNMFGYHDVTDESDSAMQQPLCWITNDFDRSPAELLWVPHHRWGPLGGSVLNLSYGYGKLYVVPFETIDGQQQGGMCELPIPQFPTGTLRARFHPTNGHLYTCGMFAWAGNQHEQGGFFRVRKLDNAAYLPTKLQAHQRGMKITFTDPVDRTAAESTESYAISAWDLKRTARYGSDHYHQRSWPVTAASLSDDGYTIDLTIPDIAPTWGMEIRCFLKGSHGEQFERRIHNSIYRLAGADTTPSEEPRAIAPVGKDAKNTRDEPEAAKSYYDPVEREVAGWKIDIEPRLLAEANAELADSALTALENHLQRVRFIVPEAQLEKLQQVRIWVELENRELGAMQYHPDRGWLIAHGHDPRLEKHVHVPVAKDLIDRRTWEKHPYVILHELAHAYHDQVLGFDEAKIRAAYDQAKEQGHYQKVLLFTGQRVEHYGMTNHKEYFAEGTEAYLGVNDFYPFVRAELKEHDPRLHAVLEEVWGPRH